ncbi:MAG: saccharopine dehydrogenase C-terminal domain-containing protein, partial [Bacteroidales bacterium]|nr:saccharopine dehydrogenase C-terminal domain-containing protein [Bacteroidales bacterium]
NGKVVVLPALTEPELIDFEEVGTLECFNSDGLRSLVHTMQVPDMVEKTMRYPGHSELMRVLGHAGFFNHEPLEVEGKMITPLAVTSKILFSQWKLQDGEEDITVMKITAKGMKNGVKKAISWSLYDQYDRVGCVHSMARTTGYAATSALRMVAKGLFTEPGVHVPEFVGRHPKCVQFMLDEQRKKGVVYSQSITTA